MALRDCVQNRTGSSTLAQTMYSGVRLGGSPYFYNWYRWGYGWGYERQYQELTEQEHSLADVMLNDYFESEPLAVCANSLPVVLRGDMPRSAAAVLAEVSGLQ